MKRKYIEKSLLTKTLYYLNPIRIVNWLYYKIIVRRFLFFLASKGGYSKKTFNFSGKKYNYFIHKHNATFYNERAVELPIILEMYKKYDSNDILEVGDVLSHYIEPKHKVIDKFEKGPHIETVDAIYYNPGRKYQLIVSVSTIEHIGWDDDPFKPELVLEAIKNLVSLLSENGMLIVTAPIGYNEFLDENIVNNKLGFKEQRFLKRDKNNEWVETTLEFSMGKKYGKPFPSANALYVGIYNAQ